MAGAVGGRLGGNTRERFKNMQFTLVSRVWGRSGRGMASAVRARRAWPVAAREQLEKTYSLITLVSRVWDARWPPNDDRCKRALRLAGSLSLIPI